MIQCPACEVSPPEIFIKRQETDRVSYWSHATETPQGLQLTEAGEHERECIDVNRDDELYVCGGCGMETEDPDDFLTDDDEGSYPDGD